MSCIILSIYYDYWSDNHMKLASKSPFIDNLKCISINTDLFGGHFLKMVIPSS